MSDGFWMYFFQFLTAMGVAYGAWLARMASMKAEMVEQKIDTNTKITCRTAADTAQAISEVQQEGTQRMEKLKEVATAANGLTDKLVAEAFERGRMYGLAEVQAKMESDKPKQDINVHLGVKQSDTL